MSAKRWKTRLSSIESQPRKVIVVVVVFVIVVHGPGIVIDVVVVIIVGHRNLTLKFGQKRVNNNCGGCHSYQI